MFFLSTIVLIIDNFQDIKLKQRKWMEVKISLKQLFWMHVATGEKSVLFANHRRWVTHARLISRGDNGEHILFLLICDLAKSSNYLIYLAFHICWWLSKSMMFQKYYFLLLFFQMFWCMCGNVLVNIERWYISESEYIFVNNSFGCMFWTSFIRLLANFEPFCRLF